MECESIKSSEFKRHIDTLLIEYGYSINTVCIQKRNKNKNKNKEQEEEKEYKEEITQKFKKPTLEEIQSYCSEKPFL